MSKFSDIRAEDENFTGEKRFFHEWDLPKSFYAMINFAKFDTPEGKVQIENTIKKILG